MVFKNLSVSFHLVGYRFSVSKMLQIEPLINLRLKSSMKL